MTIKVVINGALGKMGRVIKDHIVTQKDLQLVAAIDHEDDLAKIIKESKADVVIDFTTPQTVFNNAQTIIAAGVRPVIGTTGMTLDQIQQLEKLCKTKKLGGIVAPNFSMGAILMMKYAQDAAKYFSDAEIIEMHHAQKIDAPSGTAAKTAQMMAQSRKSADDKPHKDRARGELHHGITIHSVRLPGFFAHQTVIFGGNGETLTIRHDSTDRAAYMPGIFHACREVMKLDHLVYGLEHIL
jgi:4-hydroxy-tetrahydrodipicolinate reductase